MCSIEGLEQSWNKWYTTSCRCAYCFLVHSLRSVPFPIIIMIILVLLFIIDLAIEERVANSSQQVQRLKDELIK